MYCTNCGSELDEDAAFCTKCGIKKDSMDKYLYCENCGVEIAADAAFCTGCGRAIPEEILETKKKLLKKQEEQKIIKKLDAIAKNIVLGIACFIIMLGLFIIIVNIIDAI